MNNYENRDNRNRNEATDGDSTQLFVAKGRNHGMDQGALIEFIAGEAGIDPSSLTGPKVLDDFSFITVPYDDAGRILDHFQAIAGEGRPLVSKAKRKTESRFEGRRDGGFDRDRRPRNNFGGGNSGGGYRNNDRDRDSRSNDRRGNGGGFGGGNRERDGNRSDDRRGNSSGGYRSRPRRDDY